MRNEGTAFALPTARPSRMTKIHWRSNTSGFIYFFVKLACIKQSPALGGRVLLFRVANKFVTFTNRSLWEDVQDVVQWHLVVFCFFFRFGSRRGRKRLRSIWQSWNRYFATSRSLFSWPTHRFVKPILTIVIKVEWLWNPLDSFVIRQFVSFFEPDRAQRSIVLLYISFWTYWPIETSH